MARIRSGVLGNIRGKVAGVVGSQWKDQNYLREYIKPANPNTTAQQAHRAKMTACVAFCKPLVGSVFNSYTDKFLKSMSGFNRFIKSNILHFDTMPAYPSIKISEGKLSPIATLVITYNTADGETILTWDKNLGNNGADSDSVFWCVYDKSTGIWYFQDAEVDRNTETDSQTLPTGLTATNLLCWALAVKYQGTIVNLISDSVYDVAAAP